MFAWSLFFINMVNNCNLNEHVEINVTYTMLRAVCKHRMKEQGKLKEGRRSETLYMCRKQKSIKRPYGSKK